MRGIDYLRRKLNKKRSRVLMRYKYYEMKNTARDLEISTPPKLRWMNKILGWNAKAVDVLADRLAFMEFNDDLFGMTEIYKANNWDILFDSAILSALISSCCFIYISEDEDGYPRLRVIDGANATGIMDEITGMLTEGYAVLTRGDNQEALVEAYFTPGATEYFDKINNEHFVIENNAPYPLLVPIVYRPDAKREFGHSRISRACMDITNTAMRIAKRTEVSAEFYSFPQKYITGLSQDAEIMDKWSAAMSAMLAISSDDEGKSPSIGQFQQMSMQPHIDHMRMQASLFAAETGLSLDDLGFPSDNPSSADAIKASHENLRLIARKAQRCFGSGFINTGYLAACVRDQKSYARKAVADTRMMWEPIFEPDAAMLAGIGDGVGKLNAAIPNYIGEKALKQLTGIKPGE